MADYKKLLEEDTDWDDGLALAEELVTEAITNNTYGLLTKKSKCLSAFSIRNKINLKRKSTNLDLQQSKKVKRDDIIISNQDNQSCPRQLQPVSQTELEPFSDVNVAGPSGISKRKSTDLWNL